MKIDILNNYTIEEILIMANEASSLSNLCEILGYKGNTERDKIQLFLLKNDFDLNSFKTKKSILDNREKLELAINNNSTYSAVLTEFNLKLNGGNLSTLKTYITNFGISTQHFGRKDYPKNNKSALDIAQMFCKNSPVSTGNIKRFIIKEKIIPYICIGNECGLTNIWKNKKLVLHLDHINGINNDNTLSNLRFLCPNCHSQTLNYSRKNNRVLSVKTEYSLLEIENKLNEIIESLPSYKSLSDILKSYNYNCNSNTIPALRNLFLRQATNYKISNFFMRIAEGKVDYPPPLEVLELVKKFGYRGTGEKLGCTDSAVRKYLKRHNINYGAQKLKEIRSIENIERKINNDPSYIRYNRREWPEGTGWCSGCQKYKPLLDFNPAKIKDRGICCKSCKNNKRNKSRLLKKMDIGG